MDMLELKDTTHFLRDLEGYLKIGFPKPILAPLFFSVDSDDPINLLP